MSTDEGFGPTPDVDSEDGLKHDFVKDGMEILTFKQKVKLIWDKLPIMVYTAMFIISFFIITIACAINGINIFTTLYNIAHILLWMVFLSVLTVSLYFYIMAFMMELDIVYSIKRQITYKG